MTGLDISRTSNRRELTGTATGLANVGGFTATLITMLGIGLVFSLSREGIAGLPARRDRSAFRLAFAVAYLVWLAGIVAVLRLRRRVARASLELAR